ncbi:Putative ribonuclease H protein At1g65750, partial [Linum perenne]
TAYLPLSLYDKIDRKVCNFIWVSTNGVRKIHNVNWETVCKPKVLGGLGLRSARELNLAFLMKVAWNIITKPEEFWVKTLVSKYLIKNGVGFILRSNSGYSSLWRGVFNVWNQTFYGIRWSINDGKKTNFWNDKWLDSGEVLINHAADLQRVSPTLSVSDFALSNGTWDMNKLYGCLTNEALLQLMTNEERRRRHIAIDASSLECKDTCENLDHVFRSCKLAQQNDHGRFVSAFSANLGSCSIMRDELQNIVEGTKRAWDIGIRNLRIQTDSEAAVRMLTNPACGSNQHASLIH